MKSNIIETFFVSGPRGDPGQRGLLGNRGSMGPPGIQGNRGEKGEKGEDSDNIDFIKKNTLWCADGQFCNLPEGKYINSSINIREGNFTVRGLSGLGVDMPKEKLDVDGSINIKVNEAFRSSRNWIIGQNEKRDIIIGDTNIENNIIFRSKRGGHVLFRTDGLNGFNNPNPNDVIDVIGNVNIDNKGSYKIGGFNLLSVDVEGQVVYFGNDKIPLNYAFRTKGNIPMIITSDGKIGINTVLPQNAFTINTNEPGFSNGLLLNNSFAFGRDRGAAGNRISFQRSDLINGNLININMAAIESGNIDEQNPTGGFLKFYVNPLGDNSLVPAMSILPDSSVNIEKSVTAEVYYAGDQGFVKKSSIRYKDNVKPIKNALNTVCKLGGKVYRSKNTQKFNSGLIAEEVNKVLPHIVGKNSNKLPDNIEYNSLIPYLIESIKELKHQNEYLNYQISNLKKNT